MTLRLREIGVATAYATVGVGDVVREMENARRAADDLEDDELVGPEVVFLLGQSDIATIYETPNFKSIFDLRYPRAASHASIVNWVFSVPYDLGRKTVPEIDEAPFRFIIHLRLRRAVYAYRGIEEKITDKLTELLGQHFASARIHVGLGWSDLIVEGYFTDTSFPDLVDFIIQVHGLRIAHGPSGTGRLPILQRLLTVFGYRGEKAPLFASDRHLTFLRCKPGTYDEIAKLFGPDAQVDILDGKADFMITSDGSDPTWLARQRELGDGRYKQFLRKVETHLMLFPAEKFANRGDVADLLIDVGEETLHVDDCGCNENSSGILGTIETTMRKLGRKLLPPEQRYAIDNTLFLLGAALRDSSTCCDMRDAVVACTGGLLKTLQRLEERANDLTADEYQQMWLRLDDWHRLSELFLRQRIVGSYEEILGTSDRSIVYSGGVQKFLYLADQVMMDFARRVQPIDPPKFATIFDSVKTIFSFFTSGRLVRMPTSQMFSFPLMVPDLWHEVAGALFFLRFQEEFRELAPDDKEFIANVADHYADLLVYLHGFRGEFIKFALSLFHGWRLAYRDAPDGVQLLSRGHLLLRLYLVFEFDRFRAVQQARDLHKAANFPDEPVEALIALMRQTIAPLEKLPQMPQFEEADWQLLQKNVVRSETFHEIQRQFYRPFLKTPVDRPKVDLAPFEDGQIVDLSDDDDLNALFGELAYKLAKEWPKTDFKATAALGESAALEYHRRQMTRRKKPDAEGRG